MRSTRGKPSPLELKEQWNFPKVLLKAKSSQEGKPP